MNQQTTILIIDDESAIRDSFSFYLEDKGFRVIHVENGQIGLEKFKDENPDLVLVDLRMPIMDGLEVLEVLTRQSPDIPLIVVSGTGVISDTVEALHRGAWDYLLKPVSNLSVLLHSVTEALEKSRLIHENRAYQKDLEMKIAERTEELELVNENLDQINLRLRNIVKTTRGLTVCSDVSTLGEQLLTEFGHHMQATGGSMYLVEKSGLRLLHALDPGHAPDLIPFPVNNDSVFHRAINEKKPILINNIFEKSTITPSGWKGYKNDSLLIFPMPDATGKIHAIISLHSKNYPPFTEQDKEIGTILASIGYETLGATSASEALARSEEKYRHTFEKAAVGIVHTDTEGRFQRVNQTFCEIVDYTHDELLKLNIEKIIHPDNLGSDKKYIRQILTGILSVFSLDERYIKKDGSIVWVHLTVSLVRNSNGSPDYFIRIIKDITERKHAEEQLNMLNEELEQRVQERTYELESINKELKEFAYVVSHDLKSPLRAIGQLATWIEEDYASIIDEEGREKLTLMCSRVKRMDNLINGVLQYSRIGHLEENIQNFDLNTVLTDIIDMIAPQTRARIIIEGNMPTVKGDKTRISQAFQNLIDNAIKFIDRTDGIIKVGYSDQGDYQRFYVADNGPGIDKKYHDRVFQIFQTLKARDEYESTGIGLTLVKKIIGIHGGKIWIDPKSDEGCTVFFTLPKK